MIKNRKKIINIYTYEKEDKVQKTLDFGHWLDSCSADLL